MVIESSWPRARKIVEDSLREGREILLEIGVGAGEFLSWVAATGEYLCVGSEIKKKRVEKCRKKLVATGKEAILLLGDGKRVLRDLFPCASLSKIVINYPDPWPKKHQGWRRVSFPYFVELMTERLKKGGVIHLATDHYPLFEEFSTVLLEKGKFKPLPARPQKNIFRGMITRYETQWIAEGRDLYLWSFMKREDAPCRFEWEPVSPGEFNVKELPHGKVVHLDGWVVKLLYRKEHEIRLLVVEKESTISYNLLFREEDGKLKLINTDEFVYSSQLDQVLRRFFDAGNG